MRITYWCEKCGKRQPVDVHMGGLSCQECCVILCGTWTPEFHEALDKIEPEKDQ